MSWVTFIWAMIVSACLTLALVHLLVWSQRREARANLLFSLLAAATAVFAGCELWMMRTENSVEFGMALQWLHAPVWVVVVSLVGFVRLYLRAGRLWLAWTVCGVRTLSLILNFIFTPNLNYREITSIRHVPFLGETVTVGEGVPNPWMLIGQLSLLLLVIFLVDAALTVWRRGSRRQAILLGGSMVLFAVVGIGQAIMVLWGFVHAPIMVTLSFMGVVLAMGYELSRDLIRAARLSDDLRESQRRLALATQGGNLGVWVRELVRDEIWASDKWRELFGFEKSERLDVNRILQRLHPEDRDVVSKTLTKALAAEGSYETEYRVVLPDGGMRWIASRGSVEFDAIGKPVRIRGVSIDITARKLAEEAAHELSGRLIQAQEQTQMQLARELHDDLSQRLALLSIELDMFGQSQPAEREQMQAFSGQVKSLSLEIHRLSHELHPAALEQLGLVAALRAFCEEFALAHRLDIEFTDGSVPRAVPEGTALCLYRIAQEALHNVVRHSRGTAARVEIVMDGAELRLTISDNGVGFDPRATRAKASLGLVSMSERARFVHGRLSVESDAGKGTTVAVRVPVNAADDR